LNRIEAIQFLKSYFAALNRRETASSGLSSLGLSSHETTLKPFFDFIVSLKQALPLSIPLLRDLALLGTGGEASGVLKGRMERRYSRLCRMQEELGRLNLQKAAPGVSPEDYIFSQIDFSRYHKIEGADFILIFQEGVTDFNETFFRDNFNLCHDEIRSLIGKSYEKTQGTYRIRSENPLILSVMRTLDTSLEDSPLFTAGEINSELKSLFSFLGGNTVSSAGESSQAAFRNKDKLFPLLVLNLDNVIITHRDGMKTRLFISPEGALSGTFRPGDKPWTRVLIPAKPAL